MRRLIADLYKIVYKRTGSKAFSLFFAIGYISALNLLTVYGLLILTEDWLPEISFLHTLFTFPHSLVTIVAMLSFNFWIMLPLHKLSEEVEVRPMTRPLILYSLISGLLYAYTLLADKLF